MADMDMEMDKPSIIMRTFSKNQRARSPAIMAILKENKEKIVNKKKEWIHVKDQEGRNALHYAASTGYLNGVECLLQNCDTCNMERDKNGFYPLHLALAYGHIEVVKKLLENCPNPREIIDKKGRNIVHIAAIMGQFDVRLTWCQLKSADIQNAGRGSHFIEVPSSPWKPKAKDVEFYKDRINTLMLVSTLITTVAFAVGFTLPGGTNSSAPGQGMALMLYHVWFKPFILCTTISMYGGIIVTIILIWAQLGDVTLALFALQVARPLLGVTLAALSIAFLAGVHLVISDLSWLATTL
ncbi:26S proteasome non-ATPase regulatory subunit 10 [Vigna unguiculata]|uniref:26S proteasome non-ATPase regulatory subunit 10 n=1 Tax=Vigna unguiculata TaxID=3917 RepID=A0A4D6M6X6_VIGUN|nr:26S proteasome non-ATPase regulatory subunit 10 [Vigna unguiculata]